MNFLVLGVVAFALLVWAGRRPGAFTRRVRRFREAAHVLWGNAASDVAAMDVREARRILGVGDRADRAAIEAAYRNLMRTAHPDRGGSSEHAAKINAARDLLLGP